VGRSVKDNERTLSAHTTRFRFFGRPVYYGWVLAYAVAVAQLVSWGIVYYAFSVLLLPMQRDLGWSNGEITGAFSLSLLVSGLVSIWIGRRLDAYGPRLVMSAGSVAAVALVIAWSQVRTLPALYAIWAAFGIVSACVLYEPAFWIAATWFRRGRGLALTVITFFGGLASTVFVPLTASLNASLGWRNALLVLAGILAVITVPIHVILLRHTPEHVGEHIDGDARPAPADPHIASIGVPPGIAPDLLHSRPFWLLTIAFSLSGLAWSAMSVHLITFELTRGVDSAFVATVVGSIGVLQVIGRLTLVPLADRWSARGVSILLMVLQMLALAALLALPLRTGLIVYAIFFGVGFGTFTPMRPALVADAFGRAHFGRINGTINLVNNLTRAIAPVAVGALAAPLGYTPILIALAAGCALGTVAIALYSAR
jgi:MFS family permease